MTYNDRYNKPDPDFDRTSSKFAAGSSQNTAGLRNPDPGPNAGPGSGLSSRMAKAHKEGSAAMLAEAYAIDQARARGLEPPKRVRDYVD